MREIKFRAWCSVDKEMLNPSSIEFLPDGGVNIDAGDKGPHDCGCIILMQFTGLKDKNGTDIYEGDIVVAEMLELFNEHVQITIAWDDGGWWGAIVTDLLDVDRDESHLPRAEELSGFDPVRVIGNVHEDSELMA